MTPWTITRQTPWDFPGKNTGMGCHLAGAYNLVHKLDTILALHVEYKADQGSRNAKNDNFTLECVSSQQSSRCLQFVKWVSWWLCSKESAYQCRRFRFHPQVRKISWIRKWQLIPVFLPGKSHGQKSVAGYSPWGHKKVGHDLATKQQFVEYRLTVITGNLSPPSR